jgi:hypothetical protein
MPNKADAIKSLPGLDALEAGHPELAPGTEADAALTRLSPAH